MRTPPHGAQVFVVYSGEAYPAILMHQPLGQFGIHFTSLTESLEFTKLRSHPPAPSFNVPSTFANAASPWVALSAANLAAAGAAAAQSQPTSMSIAAALWQQQHLQLNSRLNSSVPRSNIREPGEGGHVSHAPVCSPPMKAEIIRSTISGASPLPDGETSEVTHRPMRNGMMKKVCTTNGCKSFVTKYGLCKRHGGMDKYVAETSYENILQVIQPDGVSIHAKPLMYCWSCLLVTLYNDLHLNGPSGTVPDCNTNTEARGLCRKHGATGFCASVGCNSYAHARGFCRLHCDRGICSAPDCKSFAQAKGMCRKHGIRTLCSTKGCISFAMDKGLCRKHSIDEELTNPHLDSVKGCSSSGSAVSTAGNALLLAASYLSGDGSSVSGSGSAVGNSKRNDLPVALSGAGAGAMTGAMAAAGAPGALKYIDGEAGRGYCTFAGCTTKAVARALCSKHGANGKCKTENCNGNAVARGCCRKHDTKMKETCIYEDCTAKAHVRKLCVKHGTTGACAKAGCPRNAVAWGVCMEHLGDRSKNKRGAGAGAGASLVGSTDEHVYSGPRPAATMRTVPEGFKLSVPPGSASR